jgi:acyl transferase domain-containing protein
VGRFWRNLCDGVESISTFGERELAELGLDPEILGASNYVRARGVLEGIELFDASFFDLTPREAEVMEPQIRLFLEHSWEALEHAGYDPETYGGLVGVFGGMSMGEYLYRNLLPNRDLVRRAGGLQLRIFNDKDFLTSLVAYKLNLKGPTVNVQSACSTSLVATHLACQSLLSYQCDLALAGGSSVTVPQKAGYFAHEGVFSPDGHCRAFDAAAEGTVSGNAVGVVVLKRLSEALEDGDHVHAVIRGSAINNDGSLKVGYTAPSVDGQAEVIALAQAVARVGPESIGYVEAHGTGTPLGDPVEIAALTQVFGAGTDRKRFCAVGSVKTNIGHSDAAAGVSSLIKTVLTLEHGVIPPSLNFARPNPQINFDETPFYVNDKLRAWESDGPRRAAVSSFAIGGINAHLILEGPPPAEEPGPARPWQLVLLSAKTETALEAATDNLAAHLARHPELALADVAHTLQVGRRAFAHRRAVVCRETGELIEALTTRNPRRLLTGAQEPTDRPVAFMFPGLGNHYVDMGLDLYRDEPVFREQVDLCCELLEPHLGLDLRGVMYPRGTEGATPASDAAPGARGTGLDLRAMLGGARPGVDDEAARRLNLTAFTQPALFVVEYALARLWMSWGVEPSALLGYSIGEYVAACLAGIFTLEDALALVARRARLIQTLPAGAMLAVTLPEEEARAFAGPKLSLAAVNGPNVCVLSGEPAAVAEVEAELKRRGVVARRLQTTHAFHSTLMEPVVESFGRLLRGVKLSPPEIPVISNVTGLRLTDAQATDPAYWATHLARPVLFGRGIRELWREPGMVLLEVGPGQALGAWAMQHPDAENNPDRVVLASLRHSYDRQHDQAFLLNTLGRLWLAGVRVDWAGFHARERRRRVPLPTYPFERQRYWIEPQQAPAAEADTASHAKKRPDIADWFYLPRWRQAGPLTEADAAETCARAGRCLVFLDGAGVGRALAGRLEECGGEVIVVEAGEGFARRGERSFVINAERAEDYDKLFGALREAALLPRTVLHLWGVTGEEDGTNDGPVEAEARQAKGFYSLLFLAQALGNNGVGTPLRLLVVTSGVQAVHGDELLQPSKATALGPCKVIPQEYPNVSCRSVDVVLAEERARRRRLTEQLLSELASEDSEPVVAWRGAHRWVQSFEPLRLSEAGSRAGLLREGGVYLIVGGVGGIGLTLAEHLARAARARLVLTGRTPLPARDEWARHLDAADAPDALRAKLTKLLALEAAGAELLVTSADVTSRGQMSEVFAAARERFGRIDGVIHAAGFPPGGMMQVKTREAAAAVLAPKLQGALVLDELCAEEEPDFLVLCSSLNSITGAFGLVDHCAANAFLDALAEANATRGRTRTLAINWGAWQQVGQAANASLSAGLREILQAAHEEQSELIERPHPLLDRRAQGADGEEVYAVRLSTAKQWVVHEHRLFGSGVMPGTGFIELVRAAFERQAGAGPVTLSKVVFLTPLAVADGEVREARVRLTRDGSGGHADFKVESRAGGVWQEHVRGRVARAASTPPEGRDLAGLLETLRPEEVRPAGGEELRAELSDGSVASAVSLGARWTALRKRVGFGEGEGVARIELPDEFAEDLKEFVLHPALLDAATGFVQLAAEGAYLPLAYESLTIRGALPATLYSHARTRRSHAGGGEVLTYDFLITDEAGGALVEIEGYTLRRVSPAALKVEADAAQERPREEAEGAWQQHLSEAILPHEGAEVFGRLLAWALRAARVAVATRDLRHLIEQGRAFTEGRILEELTRLRGRGRRHPRPNLPAPYAPPRNETEERLAAAWQEILNVNEVGVHDNFFDLGGDSLLATQLIARLDDDFGVDLSLRTLFDAPTVGELAVSVVQKQAERVDAERVAELLSKIKSLTPEELRSRLAAGDEGGSQSDV